jgi:hypothetical protein
MKLSLNISPPFFDTQNLADLPRSARGANDKLRRHDYPARGFKAIVHNVNQGLNCQSAGPLNRLSDCCQGWISSGGVGHIVKAHQGDVFWYRYPGLAQGPQGAQSHCV